MSGQNPPPYNFPPQANPANQMAPAPYAPQGGQMAPSPIPTGQEQQGDLLQPVLPEGILPMYLAKVHPEAMAAALEAGSAAVAAAPAPVRDIANVDLPREDPPPPDQPAVQPPWGPQQGVPR